PVAQLSPGPETPQIPGHVFAELLASALMAHMPAQELRMAVHHRTDLTEAGQRGHLLPCKGCSQVTEQPRPAQASSADHHTTGSGLLHHPDRVGSLPYVPIA